MSELGGRVLFVDDNLHYHEFIREMFSVMKGVSFEVECIASEEEALKVMSQQKHDLYLLDYQLQHTNTFELLREAFPNGIHLPVILLTATGDAQVDTEALRMGVADYIDKADLRVSVLQRAVRYAIERKRVEAELRGLNTQVSQLGQFKSELIRMAAHDLQGPLMIVLNYLPILQRDMAGQLPLQHEEYIDTIYQSLKHMQQMLTDLLGLEQTATLRDITTERVKLNQLIEMVVVSLQPLAEKKSQRLALYLPDMPVGVYGSLPLLRQAITNIIDNAIKYTPEGGQIWIRLEPGDTHTLFEVEDSGYGIPDDLQAKLFQPFFRAQTRETKHISGTGLGLYLIKQVVDRHGGRIAFKSVVGQGSTFGFELPLA